MNKKKKMTIGFDDYVKANKKFAREEELARNGGRWIAKDRPHKNLKKYDRKRDKKNFESYPFFYSNCFQNYLNTREGGCIPFTIYPRKLQVP